MGKSSFVQNAFHGGEWSPLFQGRHDHPKYKTALNVCRNGYPIEEGSWVRRAGTRCMSPTRRGLPAKIYPVTFQSGSPYEVEFTDGYLRLFNGYWNVITPEIPGAISISTANPAIVTLDMAVPWQTGDEIGFLVSTQAPGTVAQLIRNHAFVITMQSIGSPPAFNIATQYGFGDLVSKAGLNYSSLTFGNVGNAPDTSPTDWLLIPPGGSNSFSLADSLTGLPFDGSTITALAGAHVLVVRFLKVATPYTKGSWSTVRIAQSQDQGIMMNGKQPPQMLDVFPNAGGAGSATASVVKVQFQDGPYLDPVPNSVATITGGLSGTVTLTAAFAAWDSTVTYAPGNYAVSGGLAYQAILANLNQTPSKFYLLDPSRSRHGSNR